MNIKKSYRTLFLLFMLSALFIGCSNDNLTPLYSEQEAGKVVVTGYNALQDSLQIVVNGKPLEINKKKAFIGKITTSHEFVYYNKETKKIEIVNKATSKVIYTYNFTSAKAKDTLSFYYNDGIWIDKVLTFKPGILSGTGKTGYKFIFPTMNRYSNSGYAGPVDAIIKKTNGQVLGKAENIQKEAFSTFVAFAYAPPPIINVELVKHGTTESYITGKPVIVQMAMQNNKSRLIVLNEKANDDGTFKAVEGTINLVDLFTY